MLPSKNVRGVGSNAGQRTTAFVTVNVKALPAQGAKRYYMTAQPHDKANENEIPEKEDLLSD